jgi:hypothetical protein
MFQIYVVLWSGLIRRLWFLWGRFLNGYVVLSFCSYAMCVPHFAFVCDGTATAIDQFRSCPSRHITFRLLMTSFCWHIAFSSFWRFVEFCAGKYLWKHLLWPPRWRWNLRRQTVMMELAQYHVQWTFKFCYISVSLSLSRFAAGVHVVGYGCCTMFGVLGSFTSRVYITCHFWTPIVTC